MVIPQRFEKSKGQWLVRHNLFEHKSILTNIEIKYEKDVAPELYSGDETFTPAADVYSFAIVAWEVSYRIVHVSFTIIFVFCCCLWGCVLLTFGFLLFVCCYFLLFCIKK